jgi:hypothetical protein
VDEDTEAKIGVDRLDRIMECGLVFFPAQQQRIMSTVLILVLEGLCSKPATAFVVGCPCDLSERDTPFAGKLGDDNTADAVLVFGRHPDL